MKLFYLSEFIYNEVNGNLEAKEELLGLVIQFSEFLQVCM